MVVLLPLLCDYIPYFSHIRHRCCWHQDKLLQLLEKLVPAGTLPNGAMVGGYNRLHDNVLFTAVVAIFNQWLTAI